MKEQVCFYLYLLVLETWKYIKAKYDLLSARLTFQVQLYPSLSLHFVNLLPTKTNCVLRLFLDPFMGCLESS